MPCAAPPVVHAYTSKKNQQQEEGGYHDPIGQLDAARHAVRDKPDGQAHEHGVPEHLPRPAQPQRVKQLSDGWCRLPAEAAQAGQHDVVQNPAANDRIIR